LCAAAAAGLQREIPPPKPQKVYTELHEAAVVVRRNGRVLMRQCAQHDRWAGLWDFPRFELDAEGPLFAVNEIVSKVHTQTAITCAPGPLLKSMKHGVTRYRITLDCYTATYVSGRPRADRDESPARWIDLAELGELPLSTTGRKIAALVSR
jgi:A/G-specific adenine glycosylase